MNLKAFALIAGALLSLQVMAHPEIDKEFSSMDADRDGKVSAAEHTAGAKAMFEKMDANRDGRVTAAEMTAAHQAVTGQHASKPDMPAADKIKVIDSDGDGVITAD